MKRQILFLFWIALVAMSQQSSAQLYVADSPFSSGIKIYEGEIIKDGDGNDHVSVKYDAKRIEIPNGTTLKVIGRCVGESPVGSQGYEKAIVDFDNKRFYTEACWLKFSDENKEGVENIFAEVDFSPNTFNIGNKDDAWTRKFNTMNIHSEEGYFWYSYTMPGVIIALMFVAFILVILSMRGNFVLSRLTLVVAPFLMFAALCFELYYVVRMGTQSVWWCNKELVGLWGAVGRSIPFVLAMLIQIGFIGLYLSLFNRLSNTEIKAKVPIIGMLIMLIPGFFIAAYSTCGITGISPDADFVNDLTPDMWVGFIIKFLVLYLVTLMIIPVTYCCVKSRSVKGVLLGIFIGIYGLATVVAVIFLILAMMELVWAVIVELLGGLIVLGVILFAGSSAGLGKGGDTAGQTYWVDGNGRRCPSGGSGRRMVTRK